MRINVYAEELTDVTEVVTKEVDGKTFYGIRLYLYLPVTLDTKTDKAVGQTRGPFVHHNDDDDSAGITFWIPWTKEEGCDFCFLHHIFRDMGRKVLEAQKMEAERLEAARVKEVSQYKPYSLSNRVTCPHCHRTYRTTHVNIEPKG